MSTASASRLAPVRTGLAAALLHARVLSRRAAQGLRWHGIAAVTGFCALYGIAQGARGVEAALTFFVPAYVLTAITAPLAPRRAVPRALVLALTVSAGVAIGYVLLRVVGHDVVTWRGGGLRHATALLPVLPTAWLGLAMFLLGERERAAAQAVHDEAERKLDAERRMAEARLQVLQSQIEPHFLFNSLAHVRRLCRTDAPAGRAMLRHLAHYLGEAQPALQHAGITLAADVDLALSYLAIQRIRMGERLRFAVHVAREAQDARVPPMTLTTLVENAIKHGLSPLEAGGDIRIVARVARDAVVVLVADNGRGFQSALGAGVGLANVRARLAMLHGTAASLSLAANEPRGVIATLVLPRSHPSALES